MEKRQFDVTALGELLIDFTENGFSSQAVSYTHLTLPTT